MSSLAVEVAGLTVAYGSVAALRGLSLRVDAGELLAVVGPSGCGKTTLLRCLAGFVAPAAGTIAFGGEVVSEPGRVVPPERRGIGLVFQSYALWPHMSALENVAYPWKVRGVATGERRQHAAALLARVGLAGMERRRPAELSGGQQQRVALARALACEPRLLLLDEPLSNVDASLREELRDLIAAVAGERGITTVLATHDQEDALALAARVAVLRDGELVQVAAPAELYRRPRDPFVARFFGSNNLVPVEVVGREAGSVRVRLPGGAVVPLAAQAPETDTVLLAARPSEIRLGDATEPGIAALIARVTLRDGHAEYRLDLGGAEIRVWEPGMPRRAAGDRVAAAFLSPLLLPADEPTGPPIA